MAHVCGWRRCAWPERVALARHLLRAALARPALLARAGPEWSEAAEVLRDELLPPGGRAGYNDHDCTWLGQAIAKLGKTTTSVILERYLRDRLKCDDPDGRASLYFIWSE